MQAPLLVLMCAKNVVIYRQMCTEQHGSNAITMVLHRIGHAFTSSKRHYTLCSRDVYPMASALLQQLLGAIRQGTEAAEVHAALGCGLSELGLLSASIKSQHECSEGADEVVGRAQTLLGAKQVRRLAVAGGGQRLPCAHLLFCDRPQAASKRLGLQLLHALIADCDRATFVAHHAEWASTLLTMLRGSSAGSPDSASGFKAPCGAGCLPPADTLAAWDCLAVLYARLPALLGVPGVRRDASAAASRLAAVLLLQPAQGEGGGGDAVTVPPALYLPAAQRALLAALDALPAAFRQQQRALEAPLAALLLRAGARGAPGEQLRLAAALVASLPRIQGDADSWSSMAQRLLATMHALLDAAYLSLEERGLAAAARGACDPNAEPLGPLACASGSENAGAGGLDAYPATLGQLAAALEALVALLSRSYPSAVPLPSGGLLLLASRLLSLDDSAAASAVGRGARFAQLCWRLPSLHAAALRVLAQALASGGSQLAPLFMAAARLLGDQLQRTAGSVAAAARGGVSERRGVQEGGALVPAAPAVRAGLYAAVRQLLLASGAGVVRPLAPAVLAAVGAELYGRRLSQAVGGGPGSSGGAGMPALEAEPARKKARKSKQQQGSENIGELGSGAGAQVALPRAACRLAAP